MCTFASFLISVQFHHMGTGALVGLVEVDQTQVRATSIVVTARTFYCGHTTDLILQYKVKKNSVPLGCLLGCRI
jgi:type IV pilus biogenesis protein CpaD/CtpE